MEHRHQLVKRGSVGGLVLAAVFACGLGAVLLAAAAETPAGPAGALDLPPRTWVPRPAPVAGLGPMPDGTGKHSRLLFDSKRKVMVLAGGDYIYAETGVDTTENYSGMQMVWSIDLSRGLQARWTRLMPWCAPQGQIQPGRPDTVVWVYDSKRDQGVMLPGFYFITQHGKPTVCPGVTQTADAVIFDFSAGRWQPAPWSPPPGGYGGDEGGSYGVYDPVTDAVYRFRSMGGWGNTMEILYRATNTWEQVRLGSAQDGIHATNANRDQSAIDVEGRSIYAISWRLRALMRYSIPDKRVAETVPMPAPWMPPQAPGDHETWLAFDPINRVVLNPVARNFDGVLVGLAMYHVDSKRWEWEEPPRSGPPVSGNVFGFDPANNAMMFLGRSAAKVWWLYRYANRPGAAAAAPAAQSGSAKSPQAASPPRPPADPAVAAQLAGLPANGWLAMNPKTRTVHQPAINSQDASAADLRQRTVASGEPVTRSYSGLAYGAGMVFNFGGGHSTHPGNDVDLYSIDANQWVEQYPPESPANGSREARIIAGSGSAVVDITPLGRPYTQHTYQQSAYDPRRRRFLTVVPSGTWAWDPGTRDWTLLAGPSKGTFSPNFVLSHGNVVYDREADALLAFVTAPQGSATQRGTYRFDGNANTWTFVGPFPVPKEFSYKEIYSAYNPDMREVAVVVSESRLFRYRLATNAWAEVPSFPAALRGVFPNFDYDTKSRVMVFLVTPIWNEGRAPDRPTQVWVWAPEADAWTNPPTPPSAPPPIPYASKERGSFVYDPAHNVFIFLKMVQQYCGLPGYECGGTTKTWAYRYKP